MFEKENNKAALESPHDLFHLRQMDRHLGKPVKSDFKHYFTAMGHATSLNF